MRLLQLQWWILEPAIADKTMVDSYMSFHYSEYTLIVFGLCKVEVNSSYQIDTAILRAVQVYRLDFLLE